MITRLGIVLTSAVAILILLFYYTNYLEVIPPAGAGILGIAYGYTLNALLMHLGVGEGRTRWKK